MDFKDAIRQLSEKVSKLKENILTEEAAKNALIMPFIQTLGYDVFNPLEVVPEMACDIGIKKGEKIDYAILQDGEPIILIECKHWKQDLSLYDNQLLRYFHVSNAKFGILTNGIIYKFYTDLEQPNKMDEKPFLEVNFEDLKDAQIEEIKKFHKSYFDIGTILSTASELKYTRAFKNILISEFNSPSSEFVRFLGKQAYDGVMTSRIVEQFTPIVKRALNSYFNDLISERLNAAMKNEETIQSEEDAEEDINERKIETTDLEIEAFFIVKSILRNTIATERMFFKDTQNYFAVNIDNTWKNICRFYFNNEDNLRIAFLDENKKEERYNLETLDDIYNFSDMLVKSATRYIQE